MRKYRGTRYNSRRDGSTWFMLGLVAVCCLVVHLHDERNLNNFIFKYQVSQAWNKADVM